MSHFFPSGFTREDREVLHGLAASLETIQQTLGIIMSEDAAVLAAAGDLTTDAATITTALTALTGLVATLQADLAANPNAVSAETQAALAAAVAAVDTVTGTATTDATPPVP